MATQTLPLSKHSLRKAISWNTNGKDRRKKRDIIDQAHEVLLLGCGRMQFDTAPGGQANRASWRYIVDGPARSLIVCAGSHNDIYRFTT